jgi:crotonobetainyl-CoA:carnitine CoA-transferase CaiB-like acyl-CoA transferase
MAPLDGLRVVDLTRVLAGPFCTMMLGDMGADVLKVEEPRHGDDTRGWAPFVDGWSSYYLGVNRSKKSVALDLKSAEGRSALLRLIASADVLVENFRPGSLAELGFGVREMTTMNPRLIYCSISGYGQNGPRAHLPGYDVVIQGEAGLMDVTGEADGEATRVGVAITDYLAGLYAIQGILLALVERQTSGQGQHVDIALFDSMLSVMRLPFGILLATGADPVRLGNEHPSIAPYETLRAKDGQIIVAVGNPRLWTQFCGAIGRPDLAGDPRFGTNDDRLANRPALKRVLEEIFEGLTVGELVDRLEACAVPCGRVRSVREAMQDPQVAARAMVVRQPHAALGTVETLGNPVKLSRTPGTIRLPPPSLGEHTAEVLEQLTLGLEPTLVPSPS